MNEPLGSDPRTWPDDPYVLFGVAPDVDPRGLRLAYNQLIRRFHPERFPEQFQRIRVEYEWLQRAIEAERCDEESPGANDCVSPMPAEVPIPIQPAASRPLESPFTLPQIVGPVSAAEVWLRACKGELSEAYKRIREHVEKRQDDNIGDYLYLFWLLRIQPALDPGQTSIDWLKRSIALAGAGSPAWWIYLRLLEIDLQEPLSERCLSIVELIRDHRFRHVILARRWRAAVDAGSWHLIHSDLEYLRAQRSIDDQVSWMSLQLLASDFTAWSTSCEARSIFEKANLEVSQTSGYFHDDQSDLDRYDLLLELNAECPPGAIFTAPEQILKLLETVHQFWRHPAESIRLSAVELVDGWVENPEQSLALLDRFASSFPLHLGVLRLFFEQMRNASPVEYGEDQLQRKRIAIQAALYLSHRNSGMSRIDFRRDMLKLVIAEGVCIEELFTIGSHEAAPGAIRWYCEDLRRDLPLRTLVAAFEVYWNFNAGQ